MAVGACPNRLHGELDIAAAGRVLQSNIEAANNQGHTHDDRQELLRNQHQYAQDYQYYAYNQTSIQRSSSIKLLRSLRQLSYTLKATLAPLGRSALGWLLDG